jgi:hypothetical protein
MTDEASAPFSLAAFVLCPAAETPRIGETLLSLAAQTNADFDIHVVVAGGERRDVTAVAELAETFEGGFSSRVTVIGQDEIGPETPFGAGVARSAASYVAALYPDDVVFAHWAETIVRHGRLAGGRALASPVAVQSVDVTDSDRGRVVTTVGRPRVPERVAFDLLDHLASPPVLLRGLALPRLLAQRVLVQAVPPAAEGWALRLAVALSCGLVEVEEVTHLERVWRGAVHPSIDATTWERDRSLALEALARSGLTFGTDFLHSLWPPRHASPRQLEAEVARLQAQLQLVEAALRTHAEAESAARTQVAELLSSASWKASAPLRTLGEAVRRRRGPTSPP